jgi:hypothetical protein
MTAHHDNTRCEAIRTGVFTLLQPWAFHWSFENDQLLAKGQVLCCDGRTVNENPSEENENGGHDAHSILSNRVR